MEPKITTTHFSEEGIKRRLDDYFASGYSVKDYCYINDDVDETTLSAWLQEYRADQNEEEDDGFMTVNITKVSISEYAGSSSGLVVV